MPQSVDAGAVFLWSDAERLAWRPPENLTPSQWAEKNRVLTRRQSDIKGNWSNENNPPLKVIMDLCVQKTIRELWLIKGVQVGGSEGMRNVIGAIAHQYADAVLLVLPNEKDGKKIIRKRIIPLFHDTQCLRELQTSRAHDKTLTSISLANGFDLQLAWSGSPSSLASDPFRYVFLDEVDKYESNNVKEAKPVDLARRRTTRFEKNYLLVGWSTPTTADGTINTEVRDCPIQLYYWLPCPHCGKLQRLTRDALKWDDKTDKPGASTEAKHRAARVLQRGSAWFECVGCKQAIRESHKRAALMAGCFATEDLDWQIYYDGREVGQKPDGTKVGVHYPSCYSLAVSWAKLAADTIEAGSDPVKLRDIRQNLWAEPWQDLIVSVRANVFEEKSKIAEAGAFKVNMIPRWAPALLMTIDTQLDHFYWVIRAWASGYRSRRVAHGRAARFEDLTTIADQRFWKYEGEVLTPKRVDLIAIDSGGTKALESNASRTDQVYQWCNEDPLRRRPLKGLSKRPEVPWSFKTIPYTPKDPTRQPYLVQLFRVDSHFFNDILASAVTAKIPVVHRETGEIDENGADLWELNDQNDPDYNRHLANMHKVKERNKLIWQGASDGARFDLRMCEVYQFALAYGPAAVGGLPSVDAIIASQNYQQQSASATEYTNPLTSHKRR